MVDLAPIAELQAVAGRVAAVPSGIRSFGDPTRLAGDPVALRALAGAHREVAGELLSAADAGRSQAAALVGGAWQGPASTAFTDHWTVVDGEVRDLASRHARMSTALDDIAGSAEHLNRQVADVASAAETWLATAATAVATLDAGAAPGLVSGGAGILWRWRTLLPELEAFAGGLSGRMDIDLGVRLPAPRVPGLPGIDGPPRPGVPLPGRPWPDVPVPLLPKGPDLPIVAGLGRLLHAAEEGEPSPPRDEPSPPPDEPTPPAEEPPTLPRPPWAPPDSEWRGPGPEGSEQGGWFEPDTGEWVHPHPESPGHDPHYDVGQRGEPGYRRVYPDGRPDEVVEQ